MRKGVYKDRVLLQTKIAGKILLPILMVWLLSACGPPRYLVKDESMEAPPAGKSIVRFISPKAVGYVFDGEEVIGFAFPKTYFDYVTDPGRHLFITSMENKAFMEADLLPGKTYYVLMRLYMGVWRSRIAFLPVNKGSGLSDDAQRYMSASSRYHLEPSTKAAWQAKYGPGMPAIIDQYNTQVKHEYDWPRLNPDDGM